MSREEVMLTDIEYRKYLDDLQWQEYYYKLRCQQVAEIDEFERLIH